MSAILKKQKNEFEISFLPSIMTTKELSINNQITGADQKTIRRGRKEFETELKERPMDRIRVEGGGRPTVKKKS